MALDRKHWCTRLCCKEVLLSNLLVILTVIGVLIGFLVGATVRATLTEVSEDAVIWIGLPGEVYMRMLKMMILPLIVCSVITGTASLDPQCNGKVSAVALLYIIISNSVPCLVGIAMAFIFRPGVGVDLTDVTEGKIPTQVMDTPDIFADLVRNLFPDNIVTACFQQAQTKYAREESTVVTNVTGQIVNTTVTVKVKGVGSVQSTNVLGLVLCCLVFGMATTAVGAAGRPFFAFFNSASEVIMRILRWFVWMTPVGVASLIAVALLGTSNLSAAIRSLGMFSLTVVTGLLAYQLLVVPFGFFLVTRTNPYSFLLTLGRPWMVTFAAASSAIAIPETLDCLENVNKIDRRITRFVVPFAASINRDGSTLFIAISCIFIAQISGVSLTAGTIFLIWILTTVISVAIPSVPSAGVVAVLINLTALNIPADPIGLLFATEWILDRLRSGSNMLSHAYCAKTTYILCKSSLPPLGPDEEGDDVGNLDIQITSPSQLSKKETEASSDSEKRSTQFVLTERLLA